MPGKTHGIEVHLPLKPNSVPVRHSPPRLNPQARKFVREWAADLEAKGIIVKSNSAWGARCILVKKKDAQGNETGLRVVQDYRDANQCIQVADCPLPRIDATLDAISDSMYTDQIQRMLAPESRELPSTPPPATPDANVGAAAKGNSQPEIAAPPPPKQKRGGGPQFWCTLDLAAGFHGLPVAKDSQDVTAFVLPAGRAACTTAAAASASGASTPVSPLSSHAKVAGAGAHFYLHFSHFVSRFATRCQCWADVLLLCSSHCVGICEIRHNKRRG